MYKFTDDQVLLMCQASVTWEAYLKVAAAERNVILSPHDTSYQMAMALRTHCLTFASVGLTSDDARFVRETKAHAEDVLARFQRDGLCAIDGAAGELEDAKRAVKLIAIIKTLQDLIRSSK